MQKRVAFSVSGQPGSGSTTAGKILAKTLGLGDPFYSGGTARCLAQKRDEVGEKEIVQMYRDGKGEGRKRLRAMIASMMTTGSVPPRPNIATEYATFPPEFDFIIDEVQEELLEHGASAIHEGRMVPHLAKKIQDAGRAPGKLFVKIFCVADETERTRRLKNRAEYKDTPPEQIKRETQERLATEKKRYRELYGIEDHVDLSHFDIVVDTTRLLPEEVLREMLQKIEELHLGLLAQFIAEK